jgi:hypothetical protein
MIIISTRSRDQKETESRAVSKSSTFWAFKGRKRQDHAAVEEIVREWTAQWLASHRYYDSL